MGQTIKYRSETYQRGRIQGVSANYASVTNMSIAEGRFLTDTEDTRRAQVCVLASVWRRPSFPIRKQLRAESYS
jgi:hypothetical protein